MNVVCVVYEWVMSSGVTPVHGGHKEKIQLKTIWA
jgi:hypothetical protein